MTSFDSRPHTAGLKDFQLHAVEHVIDRFYGSGEATGSGRFLIADETGLGKSVIARGVVARTVEELAARGRRSVTVLYICSNLDLARQNLRRLNITPNTATPTSTRLSMLAASPELLESTADDAAPSPHDVQVNLVSFTPGTSFSRGSGSWRSGVAQERALLAVLLNQITAADEASRKACAQILQGPVSTLERFRALIRGCEESLGEAGPDHRITAAFTQRIADSGSLAEFTALHRQTLTADDLPQGPGDFDRRWDLIHALRADLAWAGAAALKPDLVILDEFQRFRHLLAAPGSTLDSPAAELARTLFDQPGAKLLMLSATPYSPYTGPGAGEEHHQDFLTVVDFLTRHDAQALGRVRHALGGFRAALRSSAPEEQQQTAADEVRTALLPVMSRSERPPLGEQQDLVDVIVPTLAPPSAEDFTDWVVMNRLAQQVGAAMSIQYWKSVPHFSTFMNDYQVGAKLRERLGVDTGTQSDDLQLRSLLTRTTRITREAVDSGEPLDPGSGYLRHLIAETVEAGWWQMLWLPPSMPYLQHGPIYRDLAAQSPTKQLIFSAWASVPAAVSALLSYEANRRVSMQLDAESGPASYGERLAVAMDGGRAASMPVMTLFWPHPGLAAAGDPRLHTQRIAATGDPSPLTAEQLLEQVQGTLLQKPHKAGPEATEQPWEAYFARPGAIPEGADPWQVRAREHLRDVTATEAFAAHTRLVLNREEDPAVWHPMLPRLAAFAPGNIAYRCLARIAPNLDPAVIWGAAWELSLGLRAMFNREDTARLLAAVCGHRAPREQILDYIADGDLEAVLDEYLFQLVTEHGEPASGEKLRDIAARAVEGMTLRAVRQVGHDYTAKDPQVPFTGIRFALRYGGGQQSDSDGQAHRHGEVRAGFNSPFAPFVLASTSVGQEGIDFHWWCHRVVHWNLPSNPVDFEQREGRVNRFGGHAVRRNVVSKHLASARAASYRPWHAAFSAASENHAAQARYGSFSPWWVYPGPARIQRVILALPHSTELSRYERLKNTLLHYRLTLGQPRQEDLLQLVHGVSGKRGALPTLDLSPPGHPAEVTDSRPVAQ